jgi:hypothetical protein
VSERFAFYVATGIGDEGKTATQAVVERFRTGSSVEVHYDPKKPKRATLDRSLPPVMGATVGWLFVLFLAGPLFFYLGFIIVRGPFEDPPNLGETPPLIAQAGGFAVGIGVVLLLVAGVRAIRREEIRQRRMLRYLESAKPVLVHEVHEGELVAISGRVEELEFELDSEEEAALEVSRSDLQLPFEDGRLVHYDIDCEWYRTTAFSSFGVRDASGVALVELSEMESTFVQKRHLPVEGAVQRYLDEKREDSAAPIPAVPTEVTFQCIKKGDPVLVVGRAEDGDEFRATEGDPRTLLVASGTREEVVARLRKGLRWTRALLLLGGALIIAGAVAILV